MAPVVSEIALEYRDVFSVAKLDVNHNRKTTAAYHIRGTPTYILFYEGEIVETILGAMPKDKLIERVRRGLSTVIEPPLTQQQADSE